MRNDESILATVRRELGATKGQWSAVAEKSGVPYHTLTKVAQGRVDPRLSTVQRLVDHFGISAKVLSRTAAGASV